MKPPVILIGAGLAAWQLAREFRRLDTETPLEIVTRDEGHFYPKPQLSNALTQKKSPDALITTPADKMASQLGITLVPMTEVTALDPDAHTITYGNVVHPYAKAVLAMGAAPNRPPLKGSASSEVLSVNHLSDYATFRKRLESKKHVTLLGAGLIGCEFANDLANTGHVVHVVTPAPAPMELLLPEAIGRVFQTLLEARGIHFHTGCVATDISHAEGVHPYALTLSNGEPIETDVILSATGLKPVTALASAAGLLTGDGIITNRFLETSAPDVYAIGDCAEVEGFVLPYITPLLNCARALARTLTGQRTAVEYPAMPVTIKTPACPVVVSPPPKGLKGQWDIDMTEKGARGLFHDPAGTLRGFVLTGARTPEKIELMKQIPPLIAGKKPLE